jgi:hypothetical protein
MNMNGSIGIARNGVLLVAFVCMLSLTGLPFCAAEAATAGTIKPINSGLCLDVSGFSSADKAPIVQWTCNGQENQLFTFNVNSSGQYQIVSKSSGKCVTVVRISSSSTVLQQLTCGSRSDQLFKVSQLSSGVVKIVSAQNSSCLDVPNVSSTPGVQMGTWTCNGQPNQQFAANLAAGGTTGSGAISYQQLIDDMSLPHMAYVTGIPSSWDWGSGPKLGVGVNYPADYSDPALAPWGIAGTAASGNPATNARVQIRKLIIDVKRNGVWSRITYNSSSSTIVGSLYTNFETNATAPADVRSEGVDGISVKLPAGGGAFHFYASNRFQVAFGAQEIVTRLEARLVVDNPAKTDDRAIAKLLVTTGNDVWRSPSATWNSSFSNNEGVDIGRFKFVTNDWQVFTSHTLGSGAEVNDYLAKEPALSPR